MLVHRLRQYTNIKKTPGYCLVLAGYVGQWVHQLWPVPADGTTGRHVTLAPSMPCAGCAPSERTPAPPSYVCGREGVRTRTNCPLITRYVVIILRPCLTDSQDRKLLTLRGNSQHVHGAQLHFTGTRWPELFAQFTAGGSTMISKDQQWRDKKMCFLSAWN